MVRLQFVSLCCLLAPLGCAATAGRSSYGRLDADFDRSAPAPSSTGPGPGAQPAKPAVLNTPSLGRAEFVGAVLRENPTIESARQGWRAALARVHQTGTFEDPMVDFGFAPLSIGSSKASFGYEVGISQKLPWFGKRSLEASVAAAEAEAAKNDFEAARRELALTAVGLYDQYFVAVRSLEINADHVALMHSAHGGAMAMFESGRGSAEDPLEAESELANMERDSAVLSSQRDVVMAQMNELLHRDPAAALPPPPSELALPASPDVGDPRRLGELAVAGRPDIAAVRQRARAQEARKGSAERGAYPDVTVSTSYNSMWDMPEHRWMVGLAFNLPIQTGLRTGTAEEATAMRAQFESDARRLEASARTQVFVSLKRLDESRRVLGLFEQRLLPVARDRIDAARAGFTASRNPFMAVVEAERNLRRVELDYQTARAECDLRYAELERALGQIPGLSGKGAAR